MALKFSRDDGSLLWSADYDGPAASYDAANCVTEGPDGAVVVGGFTSTPSYSWTVSSIGLDPATGSGLWEAHYDAGNSQSGEAKLLAAGSLGDLYVCGYFYGMDTDSDMMTLRYPVEPPASVIDRSLAEAITIFPNPSTERAWISIDLDRAEPVRIALFDAAGRREAILHDGVMGPGRQSLRWEDGAASPGIHFLRIETPRRVWARSLVRLP